MFAKNQPPRTLATFLTLATLVASPTMAFAARSLRPAIPHAHVAVTSIICQGRQDASQKMTFDAASGVVVVSLGGKDLNYSLVSLSAAVLGQKMLIARSPEFGYMELTVAAKSSKSPSLVQAAGTSFYATCTVR